MWVVGIRGLVWGVNWIIFGSFFGEEVFIVVANNGRERRLI